MFGLIYCAYGLGFWYGNKLIQDHRWGLMLFVDCKEIFLSREEPEYLPCVTECFHLNDTNSGLRNSAMRWIFRIFFLDWNISLALGGCHFFHSKSSPSFRNTPTNIDLWNLNSYLFTPSLQCQYVRPRPWQLWSWLLRYGLGLHHGLRQVPSQWGEVCSNSSRFTVGSIVMAVFGILQSGLQVPNREQGVRVHARARSCVCVCVCEGGSMGYQK